MVTFSDCMTLLLTFFVLLLSFSSFDEKVFKRMESAMSEGLSSISLRPNRRREAVQPSPQIVYQEETKRGSEARTLDARYESNPNQSLDVLDFQNQKVFLVPSERVFWGHAALISSHGRRLFADVATLLRAVPNRVVVSEHAVEPGASHDEIGLKRAWQVTRFLTDRHELDKARFSISSAATVTAETIRQSDLWASNQKNARVLEIVILERSVYR